jgi:hypothetical protein
MLFTMLENIWSIQNEKSRFETVFQLLPTLTVLTVLWKMTDKSEISLLELLREYQGGRWQSGSVTCVQVPTIKKLINLFILSAF